MANLSALLASITNYVHDGVPPGGFVRAVLEDKLVESYNRADETSLAAIPALAHHLYNNVPSQAWGSKEKVDAWIEMRRKEREQ